MLKIDADNMTISMTRGDTVSIVFSAKYTDGQTYVPSNGDVLTFSAAKKVGATPLVEISNTMNSDTDAFWEIVIPASATEEMKFGNYAFDVQLEHTVNGVTEVNTIIGKTDEISPTLTLWGEVSQEV